MSENKEGQIAQTEKALECYLKSGIVSDFSKMPTTFKLTALQQTPRAYVKQRKIGSNSIPYVDHYFAERALNFIFNFRVSNEVVSHSFREYEYTRPAYDNGRSVSKSSTQTVIEAECLVRFKFVTDEGEVITRDVYSSHKGFPNPATTRGDVLKSAISKSWTAVARTFGIGADLRHREEKAYKKFSEKAEKQKPVSRPDAY